MTYRNENRLGSVVREENRRFISRFSFHDRYTSHNAPIELVIGEPSLLVVYSSKEKNVYEIFDYSV